MSMQSYIVLPVFGQKWPTVSGRTSQLGPELHPHQPDRRTCRIRTLVRSNISSYAGVIFSSVKSVHTSFSIQSNFLINTEAVSTQLQIHHIFLK